MTASAAAPDLLAADATMAAALLAIDPAGLGGAVLRGSSGPARDQWLKAFRRFLPAGAPVLKLPPYAAADRLLGGLDVPATLSAGRPMFERGLLAAADGGALILTSAERFEPDKAALVAAALDAGEVAVQRDGISSSLSARFALVALDEGHADDEHIAGSLAERLAFHVRLPDITELETGDTSEVEAARVVLPSVTVPDAIAEALCNAARALGIASLRPVLFALRTTRALAALDGRHAATDDDAASAARMVLGPRATRLPAADDQTADVEPEAPQETPQPESDDDNGSPAPSELTELLLEAVKVALPKGLLENLTGTISLSSSRTGAGAQSAKAGSRRGRPAGTRKGDPGNGNRLNLIETLRTAAPWQRLRNSIAPHRPGIKIRREDFRINRYRERHETTAIFVVDASGSAALARMAEAKGAVELILADCYIRRDRIALIAFRGRKAEVLLPQTRSLSRARKCLSELPGGGGTPLSSAIDMAGLLAHQVRGGGGIPLLVFLTDGRGNIARDGSPDRASALRDSTDSARALRSLGVRSLVIDISGTPAEAASRLAASMAATYLPLPHAGASQISNSVSVAMKAAGASR